MSRQEETIKTSGTRDPLHLIQQNPTVQQLFRIGKRREDAEAKLEKRLGKQGRPKL